MPPSETAEAQGDETDAKLLRRALYADLVLDVTRIHDPEQAVPLRDLLEGLVIVDRAGDIVPAAAESWQTVDNKSWIFTLRPELKWSNGEQLTAHDFVRSWHKLALSDSPLKSYLAYLNLHNAAAVLAQTVPVEQLGVIALDDYTLQLQLDKAAPYLPKMLAHSALLPQYSALQQDTPSDAAAPTAVFVGNGAYSLAEQNGDWFKLEANPFYRQPEGMAFTQVHYQKIARKATDKYADVVEQPAAENEQTLYFPRLCTYFYEFNFNDPLLRQSAVRSALISMVSVPDVVRHNKKMRANSANFLPQNMQFEQDNAWQPTLVEQLFQQAGVTEKNPLVLRMSYENSGIHPVVADRLIRAWSQSDLIRIKPEALPHGQLLEKRAQGDFQLIRSGWCADYNDPSAFLSLLHSKSPDNKSAFASTQIDDLLEQSLSAEISEPERSALYRRIVSLAEQEKAVLPVFQYMRPVHIAPDIAGYDLKNPTGVIYSKDLYRREQAVKSADTAQ